MDMDLLIELAVRAVKAYLEKEGVVQIGETQFVDYVNKSLGALI